MSAPSRFWDREGSAPPSVRLNAYAIVRRAVEEGVIAGCRRAVKHVDDPPDLTPYAGAIEEAVMHALSEVIVWPDVG